MLALLPIFLFPFFLHGIFSLIREDCLSKKIYLFIKERQNYNITKKEPLPIIDSLELARRELHRVQVNKKIDNFKSTVNDRIIKLQRDKKSSLNHFYIQKYNEILSNLSSSSEESLKDASYLYNNGKLRTDEEILQYYRCLYGEYYVNSGKYTRDCIIVNFISAILPFSIGFAISMYLIRPAPLIISIPISLLAGLLPSYIEMLHGYSINIERALKTGISETHPLVQKEKLKFHCGVIAGFIAAAKGIKSIKNNVKNITNVDSWKEI